MALTSSSCSSETRMVTGTIFPHGIHKQRVSQTTRPKRERTPLATRRRPHATTPSRDKTLRCGTRKRGEGLLFLLILFECLACVFICWGGFAIALGKQPEHRNWDMVERQRRHDWVRNELEQRPWWWLMLSGLAMIVLADWFMNKWEQRPWRAAMLWTIAMIIVLAVVVALTVHFGWGVRAVKV